VPFDGGEGKPEPLGNFAITHPGEVMEFHNLSLLWGVPGQRLQGFIDRQDGFIAIDGRQFDMREIHALQFAPMPLARFLAGSINQNPAHRFGGRSEKMAAAVPNLLLLRSYETQPRFMHQGRGLERLSGFFLGHFIRGELAQFLVDQRQQLTGRLPVASINRVEQLGDLGHSRDLTKITLQSELLPAFCSAGPSCLDSICSAAASVPASIGRSKLGPSFFTERTQVRGPEWFAILQDGHLSANFSWEEKECVGRSGQVAISETAIELRLIQPRMNANSRESDRNSSPV